MEFLKKLKFNGKRPTSLYYYRELQSLRDPLHFRAANSTDDEQFIQRAEMTVIIQYVGFQSKAIVREQQVPLAGIFDRGARNQTYDFERGIPLPWGYQDAPDLCSLPLLLILFRNYPFRRLLDTLLPLPCESKCFGGEGGVSARFVL